MYFGSVKGFFFCKRSSVFLPQFQSAVNFLLSVFWVMLLQDGALFLYHSCLSISLQSWWLAMLPDIRKVSRMSFSWCLPLGFNGRWESSSETQNIHTHACLHCMKGAAGILHFITENFTKIFWKYDYKAKDWLFNYVLKLHCS